VPGFYGKHCEVNELVFKLSASMISRAIADEPRHRRVGKLRWSIAPDTVGAVYTKSDNFLFQNILVMHKKIEPKAL
jgi:hypothetical protein